jgi:nucleotide-binding universal stress UspA family protein
MSLLVATDFSDASRQALAAAGAVASRRGWTVWLVHVVPEASARALGEGGRKAAERALQDEADRLAPYGVEVGTVVLSGPLDEAVLQQASRVQAALLLVGAPHLTPHFVGLGSHLDRLVLRCPLPLLVVHQAAPFEAWARRERPLKVVVGVDRSDTSQAARSWVEELRGLGPVELVAVHIFFPDEEARRLGLPPPSAYDEVRPEMRSTLEREVVSLLGTPPDGTQVRVRLQVGLGRKADHLVDVAREEGADLLVVGTHQRRGVGKLWSVSHHAVRLAPMSVAAIPSTAVAALQGAEAPLPQVKRVLVTTDFSELGNRAVPHAFGLVEQGGEVHLLHVAEGPPSPEMEWALQRRLLGLVPEAARKKGVRALPEVLSPDGRDTSERIVQAAERYDVDLVVLASHGRTGVQKVLLGSVAQGVLGRVRRPVLVVRGPEP